MQLSTREPINLYRSNMIGIPILTHNHSEQTAKPNRRPLKPSREPPFFNATSAEPHKELTQPRTDLLRTKLSHSETENEEKSRPALKLPQIHKKTTEDYEQDEEITDQKENQSPPEQSKELANNALIRKHLGRRSSQKNRSEEGDNFLSIVGMKPTIRSYSRISGKEANTSLGFDKLNRLGLKEAKRTKNQDSQSGPIQFQGQKRRRISTNCKSSISQKIESTSRPKKNLTSFPNSEKKKSTMVLRLQRPKQSPSYYQWCQLLGAVDGLFCEKESKATYKAFVGKGNNSIMVKSVIKARPWWTLSQEQADSHLHWAQAKNPAYIETLKQGNPPQSLQWEKPVKMKMQIFGNTDTMLSEQIRDVVRVGFHKVLSNSEQESLCKSATSISLLSCKEVRVLNADKVRINNHLESHWNLTNKKALYYNMKAYYLAVGKDPFRHIPETYHVQKQGDDEWNNFLKAQGKKGYWIVKPGQNSNQGCGIDVVDTLEDVREIVRNKSTRANGKPRSHIIQRYLMPFLYNKRKFDIRCYMLVTALNGNVRCYWYEEGYVRTASKEFTTKQLKNKMIHLTNDAVQKHSQAYGKHENANKLSFADFQKYAKNSKPERDFYQESYPRMVQLATDAIRATHLVIDAKHREFSFQVFGLDFMIDDNFDTWLIEVNTNPCLELCCPLLARLIPSMIENAFRIAVDPIFPPPKDYPKHKGLLEDLFETNKFTLIFNSRQEADLSRVLQPSSLQDIIESQEESCYQEKDD